MIKKITWLFLSCLIVAALVMTSCQPAKKAEEGTTITGKVTETEGETTGPIATVPEKTTGPKMVMNSVGKMMEEPQYGGTIVMSAANGPDTGFDPIRWVGGTSILFMQGVYEHLSLGDYTKSLPGTGEWVSSYDDPKWHWRVVLKDRCPYLAESWEISPDVMTFTIKIRQGIHFQNIPPVNGREMTAYDVKYVFDRHWGTGSGFTEPDPQYYTYMLGYSTIESVECPDKWTIIFKYSEPLREQLDTIVSTRSAVIYPREILDTYGPTGLEDWKNAIGTGPYILKDYVNDSSFTFEANPSYWREDELLPGNKLPYIQGVNFLVIPDSSVSTAAIRSGKIDYAPRTQVTEEERDNLLATNPGLRFTPASDEAGLVISMKLEVPPLDDLRVRQALQAAIDSEEWCQIYPGTRSDVIVRYLSAPMGRPAWRPFEELPETIKELFVYNPDKARSLLAEAGYPDGLNLEIAVTTGFVEECSVIKAMWERIGVDLEIVAVEANAIGPMRRNRTYKNMTGRRAIFASTGAGLPSLLTGGIYSAFNTNLDDIYTEYYQVRSLEGEESPRVIELNQQMEDICLENLYQLFSPPLANKFMIHQPWVKNMWCCFPNVGDAMGLATRMWLDLDMRYQMTGRR